MEDAYSDIAQLYDMMRTDVPYKKWAEYLKGFFPEGGRKVLDCACGSGKVAIGLAKLGFDVTGSDISESMLERAAQNARNAGARVAFVKQDMRAIRLHTPVDAITCVFDPVNQLLNEKQVKAFLRSASDALKSGGVLLFDTVTERAFDERYEYSEGGDYAVTIEKMPPDGDRLAHIAVTGFILEKNGLYRRVGSRMDYRIHDAQEITKWADEAGFDCRVLGHLTQMAPENGEYRLQFVCKKRGE